ncbi:MAG: tRNA (adenosine(37)-N6)-threonylcarbamoyltransferase complex ATPase subunit type 1 TsaE [Cyanobacteria bacterium RM1_2_2]|nr:tRNA (adenosine(37)-N6)-threonylcarbamoyltransferase complex ATPase subunit type 1 TsaE [Cyanobacteria bacterium RM1_2_2]
MTTHQWTISLPDQPATHQLGVQLGQLLLAGSTLLLNGNLGSGKTTLVQGIGAGLGITEPIVSPTFTLISEYFEGRLPLYHLDLYRLQPPEVNELHLEVYWEAGEYPLGIVAIEWAERLPEPPPDCLQIRLTSLPNGRQADFSASGAFHQQALQQLQASFPQP